MRSNRCEKNTQRKLYKEFDRGCVVATTRLWDTLV